MSAHWGALQESFGACTDDNPKWLAVHLQKALDLVGLTQPGLLAELTQAYTSAPPLYLPLSFAHTRALFCAVDVIARVATQARKHQPLRFEDVQAWGVSLGLSPAWRISPGLAQAGPTPTTPKEIQALFHQFLDWLESTLKRPSADPTVIAAEGAYAFLMIQPFENKDEHLLYSLADVVATFLCIRQGYPPPLLAGPLKGSKAGIRESLSSGLTSALHITPPKPRAPKAPSVQGLQAQLTQIKPAAPSKMRKRSPHPAQEKLMRVGTLAQDTGETVATIRHWIREGILVPAETNAAGFHLYNQISKERVLEIQALKRKRFTLQEIREKLQTA